LWVLALSGGLLGLEGIAQRVSNTPKLLFLVKPEIHGSAQEQFASYAYRSNAGQYFNLLWPVCLGFWWITHRSNHVKCFPKILLLACTIIMAACPLISSARGAALTDMALLPAATIALLFAGLLRKAHRINAIKTPSAALALVFLVSASTLGFGLGWKQLRPRLDEFSRGMQERMQLHERAQLIARDYPAFGTGPGTFECVFQFYRSGPDAYWPAQLHNDWLETRVTFGWIGSSFIALAFVTAALSSFRSDGVKVSWPFVVMIWLSLLGCLLQARWDFPLQVYSVLFLFVAWCSVLSILATKHSPTST